MQGAFPQTLNRSNNGEHQSRSCGQASAVKHTLYEHPITHKFALIRLPEKFADGDAVPILPTDRWFSTYEEAVAALPELLNQDD